MDVYENGGDFHHSGGAYGFGHEGEAAAGGGAHRADAGVGGADYHIGDADFVLYLADHYVEVAGVGCHPVEDAGGGAHGVGGIEFDAGGGGAHSDGFVAGPYGEGLVALRDGGGEGAEVGLGVVESGAGYADVFVDDLLALAGETELQAFLEDLEIEAHQGYYGAHGDGVLDQAVAALG